MQKVLDKNSSPENTSMGNDRIGQVECRLMNQMFLPLYFIFKKEHKILK